MVLKPNCEDDMSEIVAFPNSNRRAFLGRALAAGGLTAVTVATSTGKAAERAAADPVLALIAEEARWQELLTVARREADKAFFALPDKLRKQYCGDDEAKADLAPPCGPLWREVRKLQAVTDELFERVQNTRATTINGVIGQLEMLTLDTPEVVIAGLLGIAAKGGAV